MILRKTRYSRANARRFVALLLLLLLVLLYYLYQFDFIPDYYDDDNYNRPRLCNSTIIGQHYMQNKSLEEFLQKAPVQSAFTYEISNENVCSSNIPHALIFVISKSTNFLSRYAIRRTWGELHHVQLLEPFSKLRLKLLFLLDIDQSSVYNIKLEQSIHQDIVQVHLPEHYILSSYRDMAILHWTETFCSQALLTVKTDDDIFLNTFLLANILTTILTKQSPLVDQSATIYGCEILKAHVVRSVRNPMSESVRYLVTDDEYPCRYYPDYMSGFGYIITRAARQKLLAIFFRDEKVFHISDIYVTGILADYANITRKKLPLLLASRKVESCENFFSEPYAYACASSSHYQQKSSTFIDPFSRFYTYWKRVYETREFYIEPIDF